MDKIGYKKLKFYLLTAVSFGTDENCITLFSSVCVCFSCNNCSSINEQ